ncbi:MAG: hypothetical protein R2697_20390 [Ilumatobacteraceae bacterium]
MSDGRRWHHVAIEPMADPDPTRAARTRGNVLAVSVGFVTLCSIVGFFGSGRRIIVVQPGGATFDDRVLPVFFLAFFATAIVSWRWPRIGGVLALFVVAGFVPFAINQLEPWSAVVVIAAFGIPALLWTALGDTTDHRRPRPRPRRRSRRRSRPRAPSIPAHRRGRGRRRRRRFVDRPIRLRPGLGTHPPGE